ncbi:MAG: hydantoinase/oxoprolinase family protein [Hyphomicrobiales bacterium]|nr:hydantoinase/oxoprolinase family protein [Hyphomicrobiales bacterium]
MALLLGIDTGGTFTDAALLDISPDSTHGEGNGEGRGEIVAKAKSLTTRHDFAIGVADAARQVIEQAKCDPAQVGMVSLSTTLATNALVEGQGGRVALIAIGFAESDLNNAGLKEALGNDPVILLPGGHTTHGAEAAPLDMTALEDQLEALSQSVTGFAVAGYFAVRNPSHELAVRDFLIARTGKAVTCSHELSAQLNGPKRALTTVLNSRLVPTITRLIDATKRSLSEHNIDAPLMIVRGDGALVGSDFATRRPIETILSGPAASLVGAHYLTGADRAFVNDIGGTTSDVAILENGRPMLDPQGARVGGFRTMVEAVAMHTFGLGGDSEITLGGSALKPQLNLGPRRLIPVSLMGHEHGALIHTVLDRQLKSTLNGRHDGRFAKRSGMGLDADLPSGEAEVYNKITDVPQALDEILQGTRQSAALDRLVARGLVQIAGLTPSDAMHGLGQHDIWDQQAALKCLRLFGRQRDGSGKPYCEDPQTLAKRIISRVERRSAEVVLETALQSDGKDGSELLNHPLITEVLDHRGGGGGGDGGGDGGGGKEAKASPPTAQFMVKLDRQIIGLGASSHAYHPAMQKYLDVPVDVPDHADVANAIGAVVGQIMMKAEVTVSQPGEGRFQVTGLDTPFVDEQKAVAEAKTIVLERAKRLAQEAGAEEIEVKVFEDIKRAEIESRDMLVEARIMATATGRPPITS